MKNFIKKITRSSANPENLAMTVQGILVGLIPIIIAVGPFVGFDISTVELNEFIESIGRAINGILTAGSLVLVTVGLARKIYIRVFES